MIDLRTELLYPTVGEWYLHEALQRGRVKSAKTVRLYRLVYRQLQAFYPGRPAAEILTPENVAAWLRSGGWREKTVILYRTAVCSLVQFCASEQSKNLERLTRAERDRLKELERFPDWLKELVQPKPRTHRVNNWLGAGQLGSIIRALPPTPVGDRDGMVVLVAALTGLRAFELEALRWHHVGKDRILVPHGKGDKQRSVSLNADLRPHLTDWRARCAADLGAVPTTHPVLPVSDSRGRILWDKPQLPSLAWQVGIGPAPSGFVGLSVVSIQRVVREAGLRIGISNLGPHDLRRTFAGLLDDAGVDINTISHELGHSDIQTTRVYLDSNPDKRARKLAGVSFGL